MKLSHSWEAKGKAERGFNPSPSTPFPLPPPPKKKKKRETAGIWSNYQPLFLKKFQTERCITNLDIVFLTIFKTDNARCAWYFRSWHEWPTKKFIHKGALSTICLANNKKSRFLGSIWLQTLPFFVSHKICFQAVWELLFHIVNKLTCLLWAFLKEGDERGQVFKLFFKWCCFCAIIARNTWIYNGEDVTFNQLSWPTKGKV